jgi:hypothetical protein
VQAPATDFERGRASYTNQLGVAPLLIWLCVQAEGRRKGREGGGGARTSDGGRGKVNGREGWMFIPARGT